MQDSYSPLIVSGFEGTPCITDCVMAELEKLGQKYRVALRYLFAFKISKGFKAFVFFFIN